MKRKENFLRNLLMIFLTLFAIATFAYCLIEYTVFGQINVNIINLLLYLIAVVILTIVIKFFYRLNNVSLLTQILITYFSFLLLIYLIGFFSGWFSFQKWQFLLISLSFNLVGIIGLAIFYTIRNYIQIKKLNQDLKEYKECDHNVKK